MIDGSNDQGWGFLILCAVGLFTANFLMKTPADEPVRAAGSMGTDERVVENSASTGMTADAADARDYKSADMAMDKSYSGPVTVDVSFAAPAPATNTSYGEGPPPDQGPASGTRSKRSEHGFSTAGPKNWGKHDKNVTDI